MQQGNIVKPVRFLTRKHVYLSNIEKMNVSRAVQVFSPPVTVALKVLKEQAGHTADISFAGVGPTVQFMETVHRWFLLMDVSNCVWHIHQKLPDSKQYETADDICLTWLLTSFLEYLEEMKNKCTQKQFLSKETYHALVMTTKSNVECMKYLLETSKFKFVLTQKLSANPIESFFGWLRRSAGSNDQTDAQAVLSGIERVLKTGIISASKNSNVVDTTSHASGALHNAGKSRDDHSGHFPAEATRLLEDRLKKPASLLPTVDMAAISMVGGYLARVIQEHVDCSSCISLVSKPSSASPSDSLIRHQDRGGLLYPSRQLVHVLHALKMYVDVILSKRRNLAKPLQEAVDNAVPVLADCGVLKCTCPEHHLQLLKIVCTKYFRPIFTNYALSVTDKNDMAKTFFVKPLSRKQLKL
ncbi:uncharacterized protein LOC142567728 [Dermacentor variabilis]|uniref:uncharacterized protein LOC142567728 n=1 Tax=Dermacentor variabilis TaxID=34621 RepID=UPI003F5BB225